jgi:hypothetical protein
MWQWMVTMWLRLRYRWRRPVCANCEKAGDRAAMWRDEMGNFFCDSYCAEEFAERMGK